MPTYLEHANLAGGDLEQAICFLQTALAEFEVRGLGQQNGRRWVHVGSSETYIALNESSGETPHCTPPNHLRFVVDGVEAAAQRLAAASYREGFIAPEHPYRNRRYFHDAEDRAWEFVKYLCENRAKRNDYSA